MEEGADPIAAANASEWTFSPTEIQLSNTVLGRGAFGEVRVAKWRNIDVACKSLHAVDTLHATDQSNLHHEISMLSKLRHPNLVLFLGVCHGLVNNTTSILTELLPCSLYDVLEVNKSILHLADILDIALDISNGLDYLHKHDPQIVHRDISSKNILIGGSRVKIADLGQAKIFGHNTLSRQTGMPGAMAYSAPEVLTGKYSAMIDMFSFGVLLAQMCTGEYPRIDRREYQIAQACDTHPVFKSLIVSTVSYQPHERPTAEFICRALEAIKANDRYYPLSRCVQPEKDLGILGRHWMQAQIDKQCQDVVVELNRTKSLLAAEEQRWRQEAGKVDGINERLAEAQGQVAATNERLARLQVEHRETQHKLAQADGLAVDLKSQLGVMGSEIQRLQTASHSKDSQLMQQLQDINSYQDALHRYQDEYQVSAQLLESSRRSEGDLLERNKQLKLQLDMQVEYVRDLETRLEQALTRWKLEKEALREEKARYAKLSAHSANIVAVNERQKQDITRYEARLQQYADLPLPEELKERFKDIQDDAQLARDEVNSLLRQKDAWEDMKVTLDQTIDDYKHRAEQQDEHMHQMQQQIEARDNEIHDLRDHLRAGDARAAEDQGRIAELYAEISRMKESEAQLNESLRKTRVALTREKSKLDLYQNVSASTAAPPSRTASVNNINNSGTTAVSTIQEEHEEEAPQVRLDSPYILQQQVQPIPTGGTVTDLDDDDAAPVVMRGLVPSLLRQAEIEAVHDNYPHDDTRTDIGIKHMVNSIADKEGAAGLIHMMQEEKEDERVVWRGARALRELILKDEAAKTACYDSTVEAWLLELINMFADSAVVQGHCMRLIGALAFGNDRFRRKSGERGIMTAITRALEKHADDETVLLHVFTAITNLTHNSMENRSRFLEMGGVDLLVELMVRYKESAKLMRQACWAVLSLCGTDEISRTIALRGGDSAILNTMLFHRFDAGVQQFGCWALSNLALSGEEIMRKMKKKGAVEICRIAIETHPKNAEVLRQARNAIGAFSPLPAGGTSALAHSASHGAL